MGHGLEAFVAKIQAKLDSGSKQIDSLLAALKRETEEMETKKRNFLNILSNHADASQVKSLLGEVKRLEEHVALLDAKREELKIQRVQQTAHQADSGYVLESIQRCLSKEFDKAELSQKRTILQNLFQFISIHPDNVIRLDVWTTGHPPKTAKRASQTTAGLTAADSLNGTDPQITPFVKKGVILPYHPKTTPPQNRTSDLTAPVGDPQVACSYIDKFGRGDAMVVEPIVVVRERPARWKRLRAWEIGLAPEVSG